MSALSLTYAHQQFEIALPAIMTAAEFAFRRRRRQDREEAIAEVRAAAWSAWHGLLERGKDPLAVGVWGIANNACRYVRNGRRIGNRNCGRGRMDVHQVAVGNALAGVPPRRSVRAELPHTAPTSGDGGVRAKPHPAHDDGGAMC